MSVDPPEGAEPVNGQAGLLAVLERAQRLGFIGPGDPENHIVHAQRFVSVVSGLVGPSDASTLPLGIDLGSGAGLPGLVLALALPATRWILVESMHRRASVLDDAVQELGLDGRVSVLCERAETIGHAPTLRGNAAVVVARSFGPPAVVAECGAPLLGLGGHLVVSEPPDSDGHRWPRDGVEPLGLEPIGIQEQLMVLVKAGPTPPSRPRRVGIPAKRPLF
jgi:16S rRNA (guanine527-N7)-methyltransferase